MTATSTITTPSQINGETISVAMRKLKDLKRAEEKSHLEMERALNYARSLRLEAKTLAILHAANDDDDDRVARRKIQQNLNKSKLTYKMSKFLIETIGQFCFVDLFACAQFRSEANRIRFAWWPFSKLSNKLHFHKLQRSEWFTRHNNNWLQRLVFSLWLLSCAHALVFMTRQYQYDFHRFRLKRIEWLNRTHHDVYLETLGLESEDYLREQVAGSRKAVLAVGAILGDYSYLPQCFCWLLLSVSLLCYSFAALVTKYNTPFDFYFIRNFLDAPCEQHNCRQLVKQQVRHFVESSRSFTQALMEFSELSLGKRLFSATPNYTDQRQQVATGGGGGGEDLPSLLAAAHWVARGDQQQQQRREVVVQLPPIGPLDSLSCRQMARMMARNLLAPVNQANCWISSQIDRYAYMKLAAIAYCVLLDLIFALVLYAPSGRWRTAASWRDLLLASELLFLVTICNISTVFYIFTVMFCSYDQIQLITQLRKLIKHVVALNNLRFRGILRPVARRQQRQEAEAAASPTEPSPRGEATGQQHLGALRRRRGAINMLLDTSVAQPDAIAPEMQQQTAARRPSLPVSHNFRWKGTLGQVNLRPPTAHSDRQQLLNDELAQSLAQKMNNDLLLAIMQYRIFFARMVSLIQPFGFVTIIATVLMFLVPFIGRLHLSYFLLPIERSVIVLSSCVILIPVNVALIGPASMHRRGLDLYRSLNSLLAHAIDVTNHPEGQTIYDRHLMSILRKELAMHDGITPRFATRALGLAFTYPNLVRLHFYLGFLLLSIIAENQTSERELTGSIFNDPFGLF